nr:Tx-816 [Heteropoda pingtungensis]
MKFTLVLALLVVVFSAVALAEDSIESVAMDLVFARGEERDECGKWFYSCESSDVCCEGWVCDRFLCKYKLPF